jgi:23S rRNA (uracil1939-C5)-methyltransferase
LATGGDGVARDDDGRVVFVRGGLPGDLVEAHIESEHKRFARGVVTSVLEASDGRREPPCPHVGEGCGGCDLQHATPEAAAGYKTGIVTDALERVGRIPTPPVRFGGAVDEVGYRNTVRVALTEGRAGFRRWKSHEVVATPQCRVAHPSVRNVMERGRFTGNGEVVIRSGSAGTDVVVLSDGSGSDTAEVETVDASWHLTTDPSTPAVFDVAGHRFSVSVGSFFQSGPDAAALLVETVDALIRSTAVRRGTLVDLYSGVGLFAASVGFDGRRVAVEVSPTAVADARTNLAHLTDVEIVEADVESWRACRADIVIADPSRSGLDRGGVAAVLSTETPELVLVSCDAGALGRDAGLLSSEGFQLVEAVVLDLFPGTSHVEVVSRFTRSELQNRDAGS